MQQPEEEQNLQAMDCLLQRKTYKNNNKTAKQESVHRSVSDARHVLTSSLLKNQGNSCNERERKKSVSFSAIHERRERERERTGAQNL